MALTITSTITTKDGIELTGAYGRVGVADNYTGERLEQVVELFSSESAFLAGAFAIRPNFSVHISSAYDRATDGTDVLDLAHDNLIAHLADQGISAEKSL